MAKVRFIDSYYCNVLFFIFSPTAFYSCSRATNRSQPSAHQPSYQQPSIRPSGSVANRSAARAVRSALSSHHYSIATRAAVHWPTEHLHQLSDQQLLAPAAEHRYNDRQLPPVLRNDIIRSSELNITTIKKTQP